MKILVPDTNLFLHGKFITEISWESIFEDQEITIFIPYFVLKEIDKAKYSNKKKVKKRARSLISFFKKYDKDKELQNELPLLISPKKINWNNIQSKYREMLDKNEADHQILAEIIFNYQNQLDKVYLITADYTFLKLTLELGINGIDWLEDEKYKEIFVSEDKKQKIPRFPDLGVYFDDQRSKELSLKKISKKPELLSIEDLIEESDEYDDESELDYEFKEELEELIDIYNKQISLINNHQELNLFLSNDCDHPYNDIEIYITTCLENEFIIIKKDLINTPVKPKIPDDDEVDYIEKIRYDLQRGIYLEDTINLFGRDNLKFDLSISSEKKGKHTKWEVIYYLYRIKHNIRIELDPLLIYLPDSYKTDRIELNITYTHDEAGKIEEQKRIIYLP